MLNYILWDQSGELFSWGQFVLRWNSLLLLLAFLAGRQILVYMYKKEGKPAHEVDVLTVGLIIAVLLGARLGHVAVYQPQLWSKPLAILFPFEFNPSFRLTSMSGFSAVGATLGILLATWIYTLRKGPGSWLRVLDKTSIIAICVVAPLLVGSFLNSDIEGKPTDSAIGTVFSNPLTSGLERLPCCIMRNPGGKNPLNQVLVKKDKDVAIRENGHHSIALFFFFKKDTPVEMVDEFILGDVKTYLYDQSRLIYEPGTLPLHYAVFKEPAGDFDVRVRTIGVARYPVQLFEAVSCMMLFAFLIGYWNRYKMTLQPGRIFGLCMIIFWVLKFGYEFLKEDQLSFVKGMALNKTQLLCIPLVLLGIVILTKSFQKAATRKGK